MSTARKHETSADREQQGLALFSLQRHMQKLGMGPVRFNETPELDMLPYDAEMWVHGKYVGVVEVKCIDYSRSEVEQFRGLMLKKSQLTRLREKFMRRKAITGQPYWSKQVLILFRCKKDDSAWAINIEDVIQLWPDAEIVPPEFCKDNHGAEESGVEHRYIPLHYWEPIV